MSSYQSWAFSLMNGSSATCPKWLSKRIVNAGGSVSFHQYMDWALNDEHNGAYSCGRIKVGKKGDFATSPKPGGACPVLTADTSVYTGHFWNRCEF